ncbi:MAG: heavy-metal-associated domain-containing protein [Anaerolineaceae bacterium]|nr:heavy-metal-associated domain-containing protein [Anaerolineaceae bacterium]
MSTITFQIPNISCGHCIHTIQNELSDLEGVKKVTASLENKSVLIEFGPPTTQEILKEVLAEINYPVAK